MDKPFHVYGGLFREEAIMLLRRFYVQENEKGKALNESTWKTADLSFVSPGTQTKKGPSTQH